MNLQQKYLEEQGWPIPDPKNHGLFHINCYKCGEPLTLTVDTSCGVPSETGTECLSCGAQPVYRINWWYEVEVQEMKRDDALREDPPPHRTGILGNLAAGNFKEAMVGIAAMQAEINAILAKD